MKKILSLTFLGVLMLLMVSCIKDLSDEGIFEVTQCRGTVLDQRTNQPVGKMRVKVTDGELTASQTVTAEDGTFELPVKPEEVYKGFYVRLEADSLYESREISLADRGYGKAEYDLGTLYVVGPEVPVVETQFCGDATATTAHCRGAVTDGGKSTVVARGFCYSKMQYPTINDGTVVVGNGLGDFETLISGLTVNSTYYVRAFATNGIGTGYGDQIAVTTLDGLAEVHTAIVGSVSSVSAVCGGIVLDDGGFAVTSRGVCWSVEPQPTITNVHTSNGAGLGEFVSNMSSLEPNTTYYVRAYATNSSGTAYGEQKTFTTLNGQASVSTAVVTHITTSTAVCGGSVLADGGFPVTTRGVCYSTTPDPTLAGPHTNDGAGEGNYVSQMVNLNAHTTYYVRAYATNGVGTVYGEERMFVTEYNKGYYL